MCREVTHRNTLAANVSICSIIGALHLHSPIITHRVQLQKNTDLKGVRFEDLMIIKSKTVFLWKVM
jgi:hypothetical protein